jgi:hypothetical protein
MHFLERNPPRSAILVILPISFVVMIAVWMQFLPLEDRMKAHGTAQQGSYGIVDYELAYSPQKADQILNTWDADARAAARQSLLIDFLFMPAYALFFGSVTLLLARAQRGMLRTIGFALTLGCIAAALLDIFENTMLYISLPGPPVAALPPLLAGIAASIKFLLIVLAVVYWPISLISLIIHRPSAVRS